MEEVLRRGHWNSSSRTWKLFGEVGKEWRCRRERGVQVKKGDKK